ncbi:hypothetical protein Tco_0200885 [Tanacetum coccineum]
MDNPNLTMEEYIRLEEEKARKRGKMFNWQTATYEKIQVDDDLHDLSSVEAEFPSIVINDDFAPQDALQYKSQVSTLINDEIDFRISFDKSDDEDYTIICDKNSFSYKMISVNNLKTDSEDDYEKVTTSIPSPEPAISCFDDLNFFNDFENEFPAIVYNDAQKPESDLLTEPILNPQYIDEFDLNDKTSLKECLNFYTLVLSSIDFADMALPPREQRHRFLRYEGLEYTDYDITDFEARLASIYMREVHRVPVFDFGGLPDLMAEGLTARMTMEHRDEAGVSVFTSRAWRRMFDIRGPLVYELIFEFSARLGLGMLFLTMSSTISAGWSYETYVLEGVHFSLGITYGGDGRWLGQHSLFVDEISVELDDTWAWVAMGPERQPDAAAGALVEAEDVLIVDEGLHQDVGSLRRLVERSMTDQGRFSTWMMTCMTQLMDASGLTYQALDGYFLGSSSAAFQRQTRQRTGEASTSTAQHDQQQPDP